MRRSAYVRSELERLLRQQGYPDRSDILRSFEAFSGGAEDHPWRSWVCSVSNRELELEAIEEAELLVANEGTAFSRHLRALRHGRPDLLPVPSGQKILPWLALLREETDHVEACEIYWILRSGFNLLPYLYGDCPDSDLQNYASATEAEDAVWRELSRAIDCGYLDEWEVIRREAGCEDLEEPAIVHALGLLSKLNPDGTAKHRILIDASRSSAPGGKDDSINAHQTKPASHYYNIEMAAAAICTRSSCWRADFEDSFMQIPFSFWSRRHTGIRWRGKLYAWRRGSYGYSSLPHAQQWITIALIRAAVRSMEAAGLKCGTPPDFAQHFTYNRPATRGHEHTTMICLLDDTAGFGTSMKASTFGFLTYLWVCYSVGFRVSQKPGKTVGPSAEEMVFLGYLVSILDQTIALEPERIAKLMAALDAVVDRGWLTVPELRSLTGVLVFCCTVLGMKTYYRSFIQLLTATTAAGRSRTQLSPAFRADIKMWHRLVGLFNGRSVMTGVRLNLLPWACYSDASFSGWGWCFCGLVEAGVFCDSWTPRFGRPTRSDDWQPLAITAPTPGSAAARAVHDALTAADCEFELADAHEDRDRIWISFLEALACLFCLRRVLPYLAPMSRLTYYCDNANCCSWLAKGQTKSDRCIPVITEVNWLLSAYSCELDVRFISTHDNIIADAASRITTAKIDAAEYKSLVRRYRHTQPASWAAAGLRRRAAARPELLEVMEPWTDDGCDGTAAWHPPILLPASQLKRRRRHTATICDYVYC